MVKDMDTDLFPWILGGLLTAAGAIAAMIAATAPTSTNDSIGLGLSNHTAANSHVPVVLATTQAPLSVQSTVHPPLPPGQVWQCAVNGQKIFSDSPCGETASIRQLGQVNRMDPTPVAPAGAYQSSDAGYAPASAEQNSPDSANNVYMSEQVYVINEPTRREHTSRLHHHDRGRSREN
jgi:hypothetical protein